MKNHMQSRDQIYQLLNPIKCHWRTHQAMLRFRYAAKLDEWEQYHQHQESSLHQRAEGLAVKGPAHSLRP